MTPTVRAKSRTLGRGQRPSHTPISTSAAGQRTTGARHASNTPSPKPINRHKANPTRRRSDPFTPPCYPTRTRRGSRLSP